MNKYEGTIVPPRSTERPKDLVLSPQLRAIMGRVQDQPKVRSISTTVRSYEGFVGKQGGL